MSYQGLAEPIGTIHSCCPRRPKDACCILTYMRIQTVLVAFVALIVSGVGAYAASTLSPVASADRTEIRWLLSHKPTELFDRAVRVFTTELERRTGGSMALTIITPEDLGHTGDVPNTEALRLLAQGGAELATVYTVGLGEKNPDLWAVNLPFLFSDYAAVNSALDGAPGEALLANVAASHGVVGLALTMSGGLRIFVSKDLTIDSADDFEGKRIITAGGPVAEATLRALGAEPVSTQEETPILETAKVDAIETTYSRISRLENSVYTKHVSETNHSVFLTAILASRSFFDSLTPSQQSALMAAAKVAAQAEREDSEALGKTVRSRLQSEGSVITALSGEAKEDMITRTRSVYAQFLPTLSPSVVSSLGL